MNGIIDICGNPLDLSTVVDFKIVSVDYIYQPAYAESEGFFSTLFGDKKNLRFLKMEPYGVVVGKYDSIDLNQYYPKSAAEVIALRTADAIGSIGEF